MSKLNYRKCFRMDKETSNLIEEASIKLGMKQNETM